MSVSSVSIVIRTFNEERHLGEVLDAITKQDLGGLRLETVIVDSGSTDRTLAIAAQHPTRIVHIRKDEFSFGRSLNMGCSAAQGEALVFISGHCIPTDSQWLKRLVAPLGGDIAYTYGRQIGGVESQFSEGQIFAKYFPAQSAIPQQGFFINNANAALLRSFWEKHPFDESLTGLEDMHLGQKLVRAGHKIGYVAEAGVFHLHHESWSQVRRRFEREAIALQHIHPEIHLSFFDFLRYCVSSILLDWGAALEAKRLGSVWREILAYRVCQFWGSYRGNHHHRQLSRETKERYFYPK